MERPNPPVEGIVYGEIAALTTIIGVVIALIGLAIGMIWHKDFVNYSALVSHIMSGKNETFIWSHDCTLRNLKGGYWFLSKLNYGTGLSMLGITIAIFGGLIGIWGLFLSMFRSKEVLFYKKGFYTILALIIALIITLASTGIIRM